MTREYPPEVYGGAGVHVEYLARELRALAEVDVHCFGEERPDARAFKPWDLVAAGGPALQTMSVDLAMAADLDGGAARPQPHLVRELRRAHREAVAPGAARADDPQPRAGAPVEGGAARPRRLRALVLLRADGHRGGRRGDRRLEGHARGHPGRVPHSRSGADRGDPQRHRPGAVQPGPGHGGARRVRRRSLAPVRSLRRADHAPEGDRAPARRGSRVRSRRAARPRAPARRTSPRSRAR